MAFDPVTAIKTTEAIAEKVGYLKRAWRWWQSHRYPKPPIGHYGIVVGITTENDAVKTQLKNDFIATLKQQLEENPKLSVLELPEKRIKQIQANEDAARMVLKKTESVFLIFGQLRRRNWQGADTFILDSKSAVRHSPIQEKVQNVLAQEMREVLPGRRLISANNDLLEFELNAVTMDLSARYIIATAAYLSQQRSMAVELWDKLLTHLSAINLQPLNASAKQLINTLKLKVRTNIVTYYLDEASLSQFEWRLDRNVSHLDRMLQYLDAAERYQPKLYQAAILRALHSFVIKKNVKESRKILMEFSNVAAGDATWAFDMAFFLAYEGKLTQATGFYKKAFALNPKMRIVVEIEEWLLMILSEEPEKIQFHYCVGLINYFGKQDFLKAKHDFEAFLETAEDKYPQQQKAVEKYLKSIEEKGDLLWEE